MAVQYKLRLGDGTVLAVDQKGLRTWLIDSRAMVQPVGSRGWRPLRELVAQEMIEAAAAPPVRVETPQRPIEAPGRPSEAPRATVEPAPRTAIAAVPLELLSPIAESLPAPAPRAAAVAVPPPAPALDLAEVARQEVSAPFPEWVAPPKPVSSDPLPVIPFKPLDDPPAPAVPDEEAGLPELPLVDDESEGTEPQRPSVTLVLARGVVEIGSWYARQMVAAAATARQIARTHRRRAPFALAVTGGAAAAVVLAATAPSWVPMLKQLVAAREPGPAPIVPARPAAPPRPTPPPVDPEIVRTAEKLPHLTVATVELLVMPGDGGVPEAPELFRRAHLAARSGVAALTPDEAGELGRLESALASHLRAGERARLRAYGRIREGRDLLSGEDARVLALYARGTRALPGEGRERLRALLARAVAAALAPSGAPVTEAVPGPLASAR